MKYLILPTTEADTINRNAAIAKGAQWEGAKAWAEDKTETETALFIDDDLELTQAQIDMCVDVLPERFIQEINLEE